MPHLNIEYSANLKEALNVPDALRRANDAALASGLFEPAQVKSRAVMLEHFRVGTADSGEAMVHVRIHVVAGRTPEIRKALAKGVVAALQASLKPTPGLTVQLTAEVNEMDADIYTKVVISP